MFVAAMLLAGCATTQQPVGPISTEVQESGFLGDLYSQMQEGTKGQPLLVYTNPRVGQMPADAYDKLLLDAVTIYYGPESDMNDVSKEDLQALVDLFSGELGTSLSKDYEIVSQPGPKTLRIQIALTDAQATRTTMKALTLVPWGVPGLKFALMQSKEKLTGKPVFAGEVTAEAKIADSQTGEVLGAAVDRRVGGGVRGGWKSWTDAEKSFRYWAEKMRFGLCTQMRHQTNCVPPTE